MQTKVLNANKNAAKAAALLREGELVAIPTETVYGLAANALDSEAVAKIFRAKNRPADNPLIVHVQALDALGKYARNVTDELLSKLDGFMPGALTVILPKRDNIPNIVSGGLDTVALRIPAHPVALEILRESALPLAAPSANRSGSPSPTTAAHVLQDLNGKIAAIVDGGECTVGVESTVLSLCGAVPEILRPGAVTAEELEAVFGEIAMSKAVFSALKEGAIAASPGTKYRHYAPKSPLVLVTGNSERFAQYCNARRCAALCFDEDVALLDVPYFSYGGAEDFAAQARLLFAALRRLDAIAPEIAAHAPKAQGLGLAVYNRLLRAAEFRVV
ncbi:MAG: L-threonylcarbamoyladenylate synthase [Oscillospiraceae bacterium]|nr:L-threonylcarbamoyladenylate synthase [Oscillospiraceae bacterium]